MKEVAMELGSLWIEVKQRWTPQDSSIEERSRRKVGENRHYEATSSFRYNHSGDHILMVYNLDPRSYYSPRSSILFWSMICVPIQGVCWFTEASYFPYNKAWIFQEQNLRFTK